MLSTPAPGWYDEGVAREDLGHRTARSFSSPGSKGDAKFWTTQVRQGLNENDNGDPGSYLPKAAEEMQLSTRSRRTYNVKSRAGKGSFNAHEIRGSGLDHQRDGIAPWEHDYQHLFACARTEGTMAPTTPRTSMFKSAIPLGQHVRKKLVPGVGEYEPQPFNAPLSFPDHSYSKQGASMFASSSVQHQLPSHESLPTFNQSIGPSTYEQGTNSIGARSAAKRKAAKKLPPFASSARRSGPTDWM